MKPPTPPKEIEIHSNSSITSIKQACKLARQVLDWTSTKLEVKENKVFNLDKKLNFSKIGWHDHKRY
jgi:hypothetical protein